MGVEDKYNESDKCYITGGVTIWAWSARMLQREQLKANLAGQL